MININKVGSKIYDLRVKNELSQEELANKLFVSRQAVSRWEIGASVPSIDNLLELTKIFNVTFEELLCLNEQLIIDPKNIFKNHSRDYIISKILKNELNLKLEDIFEQLTLKERMIILRKYKLNNQLVLKTLYDKLTNEEKHYIGGYIDGFKKNVTIFRRRTIK